MLNSEQLNARLQAANEASEAKLKELDNLKKQMADTANKLTTASEEKVKLMAELSDLVKQFKTCESEKEQLELEGIQTLLKFAIGEISKADAPKIDEDLGGKLKANHEKMEQLNKSVEELGKKLETTCALCIQLAEQYESLNNQFNELIRSAVSSECRFTVKLDDDILAGEKASPITHQFEQKQSATEGDKKRAVANDESATSSDDEAARPKVKVSKSSN